MLDFGGRIVQMTADQQEVASETRMDIGRKGTCLYPERFYVPQVIPRPSGLKRLVVPRVRRKDTMATAKKTRVKKLHINVAHATFGPGVLEEKRLTDSGPALVVRFPDETRTLLASSNYWLSLPDLDAVPIAKAAAPAPEPEDDEADVVDEEEPELVG
jgi:hypothetical protein